MAPGKIDMVREIFGFLNKLPQQRESPCRIRLLKTRNTRIPLPFRGGITRSAAPMPVSRSCVSGH
jgi:hypothetical protein